VAKDFFPQIDIRTFLSSDFRFHFDIDNGVANVGNDASRTRVVFHMLWLMDFFNFDVWDGTNWGTQLQWRQRLMLTGIVRTEIVVYDGFMMVSEFGGGVWKARTVLYRFVAIY